MSTPRSVRAVTVFAAVLVLAGCGSEPTPQLSALPPLSATVQPATPSGTPTDASPTPPTTTDEPSADCVDGVLALNGASRTFVVTGACARIDIAGTELDVDLTRADVQDLTVRGDDNEIEAGPLDALTLEGQANDLEAPAIGDVTVRGDRNALDVDGAIGSLLLSGNDNEVDAATIGSADVRGDRNELPD